MGGQFKTIIGSYCIVRSFRKNWLAKKIILVGVYFKDQDKKNRHFMRNILILRLAP